MGKLCHDMRTHAHTCMHSNTAVASIGLQQEDIMSVCVLGGDIPIVPTEEWDTEHLWTEGAF